MVRGRSQPAGGRGRVSRLRGPHRGPDAAAAGGSADLHGRVEPFVAPQQLGRLEKRES